MRKPATRRSKEFFRLHAEVCRSISHPLRLEILNLLRDEERSVSDLAELMGITTANTSQQLAILRRSGVLERRREGSMVFYRISSPKILRAYDLMTELLEQRIAMRVEALEEKDLDSD